VLTTLRFVRCSGFLWQVLDGLLPATPVFVVPALATLAPIGTITTDKQQVREDGIGAELGDDEMYDAVTLPGASDNSDAVAGRRRGERRNSLV
jgi:hypothetical protein